MIGQKFMRFNILQTIFNKLHHISSRYLKVTFTIKFALNRSAAPLCFGWDFWFRIPAAPALPRTFGQVTCLRDERTALRLPF